MNTSRGHIKYLSNLRYNIHCLLYIRLLKYIYVTSFGILGYSNNINKDYVHSYLNNFYIISLGSYSCFHEYQ